MASIENYKYDNKYEYLIAISHAGQDSEFIASCIEMIRSEFAYANIFYDKYNRTEIEGRVDSKTYFRDVFLNKSEYIIVFMSKEYNENIYTKMEFEFIWKRYCQHPGRQDIIWITCDGFILENLKKNNSLPIDMRTSSDKEILEVICEKIVKPKYLTNKNNGNKFEQSSLLISNARNKKETYSRKINILSAPEIDINCHYNKIILKHFVMRRCKFYKSEKEISLKKIKLEVEKPVRFKNIILTGKAGVGKSTVLKWLFVNSYIKNCNYIYLTAKMFAETNSLEDVCMQINNYLSIDEHCIVFFDGLDELRCINGNSGELEAFLDFFDKKSGGVSHNSKYQFIISTRPEHFEFHYVFKKKQAKKNLDRYVVFEIMPLNYREALDVCLSIKYLSAYDSKEELYHFIDKWPNKKNSTSISYSLTERSYKKQLKQYLSSKSAEVDFLLSTPLLCRYAYQIVCDWSLTEDYGSSNCSTLSGQIESVLRSYIKWEFHDENNIPTENEEGKKILNKYIDTVFEFLTIVAELMSKNEYIDRKQWSQLKLEHVKSVNSALCVLQEHKDGGLEFAHKSFKDYFLARYYVNKILRNRVNKKYCKTFNEIVKTNIGFCVFYAEQMILNNTKLSSMICNVIAETTCTKTNETLVEAVVGHATGKHVLYFKNDMLFTIEQYLQIFPCGRAYYVGEMFTLSYLGEIKKTKMIRTNSPELFDGSNAALIMKALNLSAIMYTPKYADEYTLITSSFKLYLNGNIINIGGYWQSDKITLNDIKRIIKREDILNMAKIIGNGKLDINTIVNSPILSMILLQKKIEDIEKQKKEYNKLKTAICSIVNFLGNNKNYWCLFDGTNLLVCEISQGNLNFYSKYFFNKLLDDKVVYSTLFGEYNAITQDENIKADSMSFMSIDKISISFDFEVPHIKDDNLLTSYYSAHWRNIQLVQNNISSSLFKNENSIIHLITIREQLELYETATNLLKENPNDKLRLIISDEMLITYYFLGQGDELVALANDTLELCKKFGHEQGEQLRLFLLKDDTTFVGSDRVVVEEYVKNNIWL